MRQSGDLPFTAAERDWIAACLTMAGKRADETWRAPNTDRFSATFSKVTVASRTVDAERQRAEGLKIGPYLAHWELTLLYSCLLPSVLIDLQHLECFEAVRFLYRREFGEGILPHLPGLYLAGITYAGSTDRRARFNTFDPNWKDDIDDTQ